MADRGSDETNRLLGISADLSPGVIFLYYLPLKEKWTKDFFFREIRREGLGIEYWDLSGMFFPGVEFEDGVKDEGVRKIGNAKTLEALTLARHSAGCVFVVMCELGWKEMELHRILTKHGCFTVFFARSGLPEFPQVPSAGRRLSRWIQLAAALPKCLPHLRWWLFSRAGLLKPYDVVFVPGSVHASRYRTRSRVVPINHYDYDEYLRTRDGEVRVHPAPYCVFLDDNLVGSVDFRIHGARTIDAADYYGLLRRFFDRLEEDMGIEVVVAAHPYADYDGTEFGARRVVEGAASRLVKDCRFAMTHYSTSVSYAVLHRKPVAFLYTQGMKSYPCFRMIGFLAEALNAPAIDMEAAAASGLPDGGLGNPDARRYDAYKYGYLTTPETEDTLSHSIVLATLRSATVSR